MHPPESAPKTRSDAAMLRAVDVILAVRPLLYALLALVAALPWLETAASMNLFRDGQFLSAYEHVAVATVRRFGELPRWDPYTCGGLYSLGNPQTRFAAPTFLVSLALGARRAEPVIAFLLLFVGMEGAYRLLRTLARSRFVALVLAPLVALNGFFGASYFHGWMQFFGFELVPWLFYGLVGVARARSRAVPVVAVAASSLVGIGSTYAIPLSALFAAPLVLWQLAPRRARRRRRSLVLLAAASLFTAGLSAVRVLPILETMRAAPRIMAGAPAHSAATLYGFLFESAVPNGGNLDLRGEFYLSVWSIPLLLAALAGGRRALAPLLIAGFAVGAAAGYAPPMPFFAWVRAIPGFEILRYPERFLYFAALFALVASAIGLAELLYAARSRSLVRRGAWVLLGTLVALAVNAQIANFHGTARGRVLVPPPVVVERPFQQARGNRWIASYYAPTSRGSISCGEAYPVPMSTRLRGDLPADEYLEDAGAGTATRESWSPNRLVIRAHLDRPTRLLVNQNHHPGWRTSVGHVVSADGLLGIELPPGTHRVELRFVPRSALAGVVGSSAAIVLLLLLWRGRVALGRWLAASLVPCVLAALVWASIDETPAVAEPTNADGSPVLVDTLPADATPIGAGFDVPVTLVGVELPTARDPAGNAAVTLYWKVTGPVPRTVGTYVHVESGGHMVAQAEREVVAASYFFAGAPRERLLRDVVYVTLPPGSAPLRFYAGLWHPSGDGSRVNVSRGPRTADGRADLGASSLP